MTINNFKPQNILPTRHKIRDMSNFNETDFNQDLLLELGHLDNILQISHDPDVNTLFNKFINIFNSVIDKHAPFKYLSRKQTKLKHKPWISKGILKSTKIKNKLYKASLKYRNPVTAYLYRNYSNKLTRIKESAKKLHYSSLITKSTSNSKLLWSNINNILRYKSTTKKQITNILTKDDKLTTDPLTIANTMNNFFSTIGQNLNQNCSTPHISLQTAEIRFFPKSFHLEPVSTSEMHNLLKTIDVNKSNGPNNPSNFFIKIASNIICPIFTKLTNLCFESGIFPDNLKSATVIPIHKSGEEINSQNYRPISLTSPFSKLIERCIVNRMGKFLEKYNLINPSQFGFRKGMSTENAVNSIHNKFTKQLDNNNVICSIFLDIKKAFDSVNHQILLKKIYRYGFRGQTFNLLSSFLKSRTQSVLIQNVLSSPLPITCGVPQGSVLGPLMFLLLINDLPTSCDLTATLFADDACFSACHSSPSALENRINRELIKISNWFKSNKLNLNYDKTVYMIMLKQRKKHKFNILIDNNKLNESNSVKYLGIMIDSNLNWKPQIDKVSNKIAKGCWAISKLRPFVNSTILRLIYYTLIYPHLLYCITSWGTACKTYLNKLASKQKRTIRIMTYSSYTAPSTPLFKQLNLLQLNDIFKLRMATSTYYNLHNNQTNTTDNLQLNAQHSYMTRSQQQGNLFIPYRRTRLGQSSTDYQRAITWNQIPPTIRSSASLTI